MEHLPAGVFFLKKNIVGDFVVALVAQTHHGDRRRARHKDGGNRAPIRQQAPVKSSLPLRQGEERSRQDPRRGEEAAAGRVCCSCPAHAPNPPKMASHRVRLSSKGEQGTARRPLWPHRIASQRALSRILTSGSHVRWEDQEGLCHLALSRTPILFVSPDRKGRETNVCLFLDAAPSDAMLEPSFLEGDVWPYFVFLQPVNWRVMFRH
jgi:hypothetical protein